MEEMTSLLRDGIREQENEEIQELLRCGESAAVMGRVNLF